MTKAQLPGHGSRNGPVETGTPVQLKPGGDAGTDVFHSPVDKLYGSALTPAC
ncbi:hypothetical protein [Phytoactinopolyspora halotolerans]|uniref:Uncharacterized protein n=1 Tax=Phytoactinopolyspora halotolerans TaxID=1981512 RepID=A0A6L9SBE5_9ACTN|nr:hypothetical protein [Phytoactinopolyspora halotolerans]NEE01954.1 hypothetical protein [Phytoactinopolyspora halotolerans]